MQINVFDLMYTYCLILRWEIVFTSDIVYFGFTFLVYKFEKEKKIFKKRERSDSSENFKFLCHTNQVSV